MRTRRAISRVVSPARRATAYLVVGVCSLTYGVAQWSPAAAWVVAGVALVTYGLVFVDVDGTTRRR